MTTRQINKWGEGGRLRDELLEAATRLLGRATSRDAVTLRAIARETGIAAPSIYKHFADRDAVIDAVVSSTFQQLDAVCEEAYRSTGPGPARVRAVSCAYVAFAVDHPDQYRVLFERSSDNRSAVAGPYPAGLHAFQCLVEAIKEADAGDGVPCGGNPFQDAEALWAALHGIVTLVAATPDFPWTPTASIVDTILDRFTLRPER
jgi:AcrR family transcriptional regulator